jgi:hypothetical protein
MTTKIKKYIAGSFVGCVVAMTTMAITGCTDFLTIYPNDRIVGNDFWKKKSDVETMVDGCYNSMIARNVQERAIIWGAFRSDELVKFSDLSDNTLDNITAVNLLPTNRYNSWGDYYKVINNCNIVLNHAEAVMDEDPEFTKGDYEVIRSQMLALRSLCYFYLVRAFRDVPYTTHSYENDSEVELLPQSTPAEVLQNCLNDLQEAQRNIMRSGAYGENDWRNKGYMTRDAVYSLMADILLWRAAMTHSTADYQQAIAFCDTVINSKHRYYEENKVMTTLKEEENDIYHLIDGDDAMSEIFGSGGNSRESILEWQYIDQDNVNTALEDYYYRNGENSNNSILMASGLFNSPDKSADTPQGKKFYLTKNDYRFWNNVFEANNEEMEQMSIRKMCDLSRQSFTSSSTKGAEKSLNNRDYKQFGQNWIVYRLTDVMLMKAEALVETAVNDSDAVVLKQAFDLVQAVNKRSMMRNATDTLKFETFKTKDNMELLVMNERERELCFEGKRWFDLLRYSYRHMEGVNINTLLADMTEGPKLYKPMLDMIIRKYNGDDGPSGDAVSYKMKGEHYLYWPVEENELKVNKLLRQNPVYIQEKTTSKK